MSDKFGNLKFYSNGVTVWNRNHEVMQNGTGLAGHSSSTQNSLIIPFPSDTNKFYIFTTEANERLLNGLQYSVVDMTLDGGLGAVTTKNVQLLDNITEKVTGIQLPNCQDFWVVTYSVAADEFSSYRITSSGIQPRVVSQSIVHDEVFTTAYLKFSHNGEKIANAFGTYLPGIDVVEIYNFNINTGAISNPTTIELNLPYGVEFSPDDAKLYISSFNPSRLLQYDMASGNLYQLFFSNAFYYFGAIQTGPDGKLYIARNNGSYLGVINAPNESGANCDFVERGVSLRGKRCGLGLPNFTKYCAADSNECTATSNTPVCYGEPLRLFVEYYYNAEYRWAGPDGFRSTDQNPVIDNATAKNAGEYFVTITLSDGEVLQCSTTVEVLPPLRPGIIPDGPVEFCYGKSVTLWLDREYESVEWSTGDTTGQVTIDTTMLVSVAVTDSNGCIGYDSIAVNTFIAFKPEILSDGPLGFCYGDSVTLSLDQQYESYEWSSGETTEQVTVRRPMLVRVIVTNSDGCKGFDSINVVVLNAKPPKIIPDGPVEFCYGGSVTLGLDKKYQSYEWSTGETTETITVDEPGYISVSVVDENGCEGNAYIELFIIDSLSPDIVIIDGEREFCQGDSVVLGTSKKYKEYLWSTGETTETIAVRDSMAVSVLITNEDGCKGVDDIEILVRDTITPVIIGKHDICIGDSVILSMDYKYDNFRWSTGETTETITVNKNGTYYLTVTGKSGCEGTSAGFNVAINPRPSPKIKGPNPACLNSSQIYYVSNYNNYQTEWNINDGGEIIGDNDNDSVLVHWAKVGNRELIVRQTNEFGCVGTDTILVEARPPFSIDIISDGLKLCPGGSLILSAPEGYVKYLWNTDETTREIEITEAKLYSVEVTDENGCIGIDSVEVVDGDSIEVTIIGGPGLCPGESLKLSADKDYASYNWSTGETTKEITIANPGAYTLTATNEEGCTGNASVDVAIINSELEFADEGPIDFGEIQLDFYSQKAVRITNSSDSDIAYSATIKNTTGQVFTLQSNNIIKSNSAADITLIFTPNYPKYFYGSLIIEGSGQCEFELTKAITGAGFITSKVWLPDTTATPDTKDYCIPLRTVMTKNKYISDINLTFTSNINTDASLIVPNMPYTASGRNLQIPMTKIGTTLNDNGSIIDNICGWILFAEEDKTPMYISEFAWDNPLVKVDTVSGSVTLDRVCSYDIRRVQGFKLTEMQISPNPANQSIKISIESGEVGAFNLSIYAADGVEVRNYRWQRTKSSLELNEINIGLSEISSGIYRIMLRSPMEIISQPLSVVK